MKDKLYMILTLLLVIGAVALSIFYWYYSDCELVKTLNSSTPGRCLP